MYLNGKIHTCTRITFHFEIHFLAYFVTQSTAYEEKAASTSYYAEISKEPEKIFSKKKQVNKLWLKILATIFFVWWHRGANKNNHVKYSIQDRKHSRLRNSEWGEHLRSKLIRSRINKFNFLYSCLPFKCSYVFIAHKTVQHIDKYSSMHISCI